MTEKERERERERENLIAIVERKDMRLSKVKNKKKRVRKK